MTIYVCHRFANDMEGNTKRVREICRQLVDKGHLPIAPQLYLGQFMDEHTQRMKIMEFCLRMVTHCDEVWVYGREADASLGMKDEMAFARSVGTPIKFIDIN